MLGITLDFVDKFFSKHPRFKGKKVLDVGSLDISGNPREKFESRGYQYIGCDMRKGANVDVVVNAHELTSKFGEGEFDIVFCVDTLEHDDAFWLTMEQIWKVLRRGGYLILGMPSRAHYEHGHPYDYWRFMRNSFEHVLLKNYKGVFIDVQYHEQEHLNQRIENQIYGWGRKP